MENIKKSKKYFLFNVREEHLREVPTDSVIACEKRDLTEALTNDAMGNGHKDAWLLVCPLAEGVDESGTWQSRTRVDGSRDLPSSPESVTPGKSRLCFSHL